MRTRFFLPLLLGFLLFACGPTPETDPQSSPTAVTATVVLTETAVPKPTTEPAPAATATNAPTVEPTLEPAVEPEMEINPFTLARQLIEQVDLTPPEGRRVEPCEGDAPVLCVNDGQENMGYVELLIFSLSSYAEDHPVRLAAETLPADPAAYTAEQETAVQQALTALAEEHLDVIAADRAITYPDDTFTRLPAEPAQMGALPALSFGFVHTNQAGEVVERYLNIAAFDRRFIYWFGINYDPANVSTFVSDTAVTQFAPFLLPIASSLPLHSSPVSQPSLNTGGLARLLVVESADVLPDGWRLYACNDGPSFCLNNEQEKIAWVELGIIPMDSYDDDDPLRLAAALLPTPGTPFSAEEEAIARQVLVEAADARLAQEEANRQEYFPDHQAVVPPLQFVQMGPLPAAAFSHTLINANDEVTSQWRWVIALDQQHVYWFTLPISPTLAAAEVEQVTAVFHNMAATMPVYDLTLRSLPALPAVTSYGEQSGDFPTEAAWSLATDLPQSPMTAAVLSQPAQIKPLVAEQASAIAQTYGFDEPLFVESRSGLSTSDAASLGLFVAFDEARTLSFSALPYSYSDVTNWNQGPDLPFAQAAPIAEQFLQENGWLTYPYETAESDEGQGVAFFPIIDDGLLLTPAHSVRVAGNGGIASMAIYPLENLKPIGRYPIITAETAWNQVQNPANDGGVFYRLVPAADETAVAASLPTVYNNIPAPGETGDFYTTIQAYRPLAGDSPPIIRSSDFLRITGDTAVLNELAEQTDSVVHVWGTVREFAPGLLELELFRWEPVSDAGGVPTFFGVIQQEDGQLFLADEANRTTYLLPNAPTELQAGDSAAVTGMPDVANGIDLLAWQKIAVYPPQPVLDPPPTAVPMQTITIEDVKLVYHRLPASAAGLPDDLFIPTWQFTGTADNGARVTVWVTAVS